MELLSTATTLALLLRIIQTTKFFETKHVTKKRCALVCDTVRPETLFEFPKSLLSYSPPPITEVEVPRVASSLSIPRNRYTAMATIQLTRKIPTMYSPRALSCTV